MKRINSLTHGIVDYVIGFLLLVAPFLVGFSDNEPARNSAWVVGAAIILYSLATDYELGVFKLIPYRIHLGLDCVIGVFLATSPWLLDFSDRIAWPHVAFGLLEVGIALITRPATSAGDAHHLPRTPAPAGR